MSADEVVAILLLICIFGPFFVVEIIGLIRDLRQ